ncbi:MAG: NAD-dependent epimerase/dehydratase family protein [Elusimicrobia bacterium]|nr:NAD-dependent epimerase/dehydratase family protein [Elusimicrobiota bacterium]
MKALVTGAGGFLGGALARRLLEKGWEVRGFARGDYPAVRAAGAQMLRGDLGDAEAVDRAAAGVDVVFHVGAKAGVWGPYEEFQRSNVLGTRNVVAACRRQSIRRLVFTSSPSILGGRDLENVDESTPVGGRFLAPYPETKALSESIALSANDSGLAVVALRPHLVWGPGDNHIVPRLAARARTGSLRRITGKVCLVDSTYIDNAVDAHLAAAERLPAVGGKAYFISNGEPLPLWDLIARMLDAAGAPPVTKTISPAGARLAGAVLEDVYRFLGIESEPRMTRFMAEELTTHHYFDLTAARRDLGYVPTVSIKEGLTRLAASYRCQAP